MKRTSEELKELQQLKQRNGQRYYVAARFLPTVGHFYFQHSYKNVKEAGALEEAVKYFKQYNRSEFALCTAVCNVSRYGNVTYGCFEIVVNAVNEEHLSPMQRASLKAPTATLQEAERLVTIAKQSLDGIGGINAVYYSQKHANEALAQLTAVRAGLLEDLRHIKSLVRGEGDTGLRLDLVGTVVERMIQQQIAKI